MFDKMFETFRKTAEQSLKAQQDMFKQWTQPFPFTPFGPQSAAGMASDWNETVQKRWLETTTEALNNHREFLNSLYRSGIQALEQSFRVTSAKSPEDYQRLLEDFWKKMTESFKEQSEAQMREFQKAAERWSPTEQTKSKAS